MIYKFWFLLLIIVCQVGKNTIYGKSGNIESLEALVEALGDNKDLIEIKEITLKKLRYQKHFENKYSNGFPHEGKIVKKHKRRSLNTTNKVDKGNGKNQVMLTKPYWPWP
uniref:Uncharacterized protein n=1 Tax=Parastrongyloides trichosuri TaxID=131310 RepID=A0A0N4ZXA4_PARTI